MRKSGPAAARSRQQGDVALVIVHPGSAVHGSEAILEQQWSMVGDWSGPLYILERGTGGVTSAAANTYREILDVALDERECTGAICAIAADGKHASLATAVARLLAETPDTCSFLVTGAWRESGIAEVVCLLRQAGREAVADDSASEQQMTGNG